MIVDAPVIIEAAQFNTENRANSSLDKIEDNIEDGEKGEFSTILKELLSGEKTSKKAAKSASLSKGGSRKAARRAVMFGGKEVALSKLFASENDEETEGSEKTVRVKGGEKGAGGLKRLKAFKVVEALNPKSSEKKKKITEGDNEIAKADKPASRNSVERSLEEKKENAPPIGKEIKDRKSEIKIVVIDLREHKEEQETSVGQKPDKPLSEKLDSGKVSSLKEEGAVKVSSLEEEGAVRLFSRAESGERSSILEQGRENSNPGARQVAEKFREVLRNEVVKHSTFVLKDNGGGELRLVLRPESLGRVRINLNLNNNHIAGRIIVENSSVKEMFESSLQNLHEAFKNEGFTSTSLEVFVSGGNHREKKMEEEVPLHEAAAEFERNVPDLEDITDELIVNLTA